jgi:hypothetical protein
VDEPARLFFARLAEAAGTPALAEDEVEAVLALARDVAHGAERRFAPLAAYAAGLAIGAATDPAERAERVRGVIRAAGGLLEGPPAD